MSENNKETCNRQPFLSEAGCDRGSVDIHQFDDLPYCDSFSPSLPDIPPEIVDTPLNLPIPPACSCISISYKMNAKYTRSRKFKSDVNFEAKGDCCEGNYVSNLDLDIPCPVGGQDGTKKISVGISYGKGPGQRSASYIKTNPELCTLEAKSATIKLNLPCPVATTGDKKVSVSIKYGNGANLASARFAKANAADCNVDFSDARLNLNIPCPISGGGGAKKISIGVSYTQGQGQGTVRNPLSKTFMDIDKGRCDLSAQDPRFDIYMPCPIKPDAGKLKLKVEYGDNPEAKEIDVIETDPKNCSIRKLGRDYTLQIKCPAEADKGKTTFKIVWGSGTPKKVDLLEMDHQNCTIKANPGTINLDVKCPWPSGTSKLTITPAIGANAGNAQSVNLFSVAGGGECGLELKNPSMKLDVPCPISGDGTKKLIFSKPRYVGRTNFSSTSVDIATFGNCHVEFAGGGAGGFTDVMHLNIPCPLDREMLSFKFESSFGSSKDRVRLKIESSYSSSRCRRTIKLALSGPDRCYYI